MIKPPSLHRSLVVMVAALVSFTLPASAQSSRDSVATSKMFEALELKPGQTVGEIGAGQGEPTLDAARLVGAERKVFTCELGDDRVKALQKAVSASGVSQITVVTGDPNKTNFADDCCVLLSEFLQVLRSKFCAPLIRVELVPEPEESLVREANPAALLVGQNAIDQNDLRGIERVSFTGKQRVEERRGRGDVGALAIDPHLEP
jgi:Protein-L-isoaspartate(D-aspartate) O-methyltransferase (PCMT)